MRRFCSICGKVTDELYDGMCWDCTKREREFVKLPANLNAGVCRECLGYYTRGRWVNRGGDLGEVIKEAAMAETSNSITVVGLKDFRAEVAVEGLQQAGKGYIAKCSARVSGRFNGERYQTEKTVDVRVIQVLCPDCQRKLSGYYEGVLQIRSGGSLTKREKAGVKDEVTALLESYSKKDRKAFITNFKSLRTGMDFYLGSINVARKIASSLRGKHGGTITESAKLVGRDKGSGRDLYRVTIAVRFPRFKEGDIIKFRGTVIQVERSGKNMLTGFDLVKRNNVSLPLKVMKDAEVLGSIGNVFNAVVTGVERDKIQVLDLERNKEECLNFNGIINMGEEIKIFRDGKLYLLRTRIEGSQG